MEDCRRLVIKPMPMIEYLVSVEELLWGDTDRPIISELALNGRRGIDWLPGNFVSYYETKWRWN